MLKQAAKIVLYTILTVFAAAAVADQQARAVTHFSAIKVNGPFDVTVAIAESPSLRVTGDAAILPWVVSSVKGGQLIISLKPGIRPHYSSRVKLTITTPDLDVLIGNDHAQLQAQDLKADKLTVVLDNHSQFIGNNTRIKQTTTLTLNNHSQVQIDGSTGQLIINGGNHSSVMADDFDAQSASVTLSNHSEAKLSSQTVVTNESNHSSLKLSQALRKISGHLQDHSTTDLPKSETIQSVLSNDSEFGIG